MPNLVSPRGYSRSARAITGQLRLTMVTRTPGAGFTLLAVAHIAALLDAAVTVWWLGELT